MTKECNMTGKRSISRITSLKCACKGIKEIIVCEHNFRIELVLAFVTVILGLMLKISHIEWFMIIGCIISVLCLEIMNSAIEKLCDRVTQREDHHIRKVKDMAAGAVLLAALFSCIAGALIFIPYVLNLL